MLTLKINVNQTECINIIKWNNFNIKIYNYFPVLFIFLICGQINFTILGDFLFGCNAVIVAERVLDIGSDGGYLSIGQAGEWRHIGAALDDLNYNLSDRQTGKVPVKSWCCVVAMPLTFTIASVTFRTPVSIDICAFSNQYFLWYCGLSYLVRS